MRRLLTPRWLLLHLLAAAIVAAMLGLAWWQIGRARDGNALSIGYSLEWPVFAGFTIFVWIRAVRRELRGSVDALRPEVGPLPSGSGARASGAGATGARPAGDQAGADQSAAPVERASGADVARRLAEQRAAARASAHDDDPETAAYNHYLGWLNAHPHRSPNDYPGVQT
ncbi:hypothetical protein Lfu02_32850 [Longispora fulva]|uniref:DNA-binding transcriptional regulator of glucitol operon n=1 Tax=Longispora fulva TaxID=619741 RepID=A0A8J7KLI9_9ACTN|nr:hypothetical protein [Longispora fulva]MBG6139414.1 hypothetical protein [Longispora fulva]GIG58913.1 hypothetical protein Lfu02_32850 [Longispora fulva]